jgi:N-acetylglucosamine PTS system EIICBA or EIICB component
MKSAFEILQPLGRALMLPIAVLPVAGLLLRLGQPDIWQHVPAVLPYLPFIAGAGQSIFANLGLLFAAGVAVGLAKENHGAAALAGVVCYVVATTAAKTLMVVPPDLVRGFTGDAIGWAEAAFKDKAIFRLSVPTGIVSGLIAGWLYNRYHAIKLPDYLAFFGGRRFVPIAAGFSALVLAFVIGKSWLAISTFMDVTSHGVVQLGAFGLFVYGALNRLLIITGLHHILNSLVWFNLGSYHGVTGDLNRFMAGDPSAGAFMAGFFPVMMFGLPAACLAMYHAARPERKKEVGGMLASMALTAFLTGVTEPIEFSFMFLAPLLYALHAVLTGISMMVMSLLDVHLGFGFSAGFFDYIINLNKSQHAGLLIPVGLVYAAVYYGLFRLAITYFDLKTVGREDVETAPAVKVIDASGRGEAYLAALGGAGNLSSVDACTTRLRLIVNANAAIDEPRLKALGAKGFVRPSPNALQVVVGPAADHIASEIRAAMKQAGAASLAAVAPVETAPVKPIPLAAAAPFVKALGGIANVVRVSRCSSRLVVDLNDVGGADEAALRAAGVRSVVRIGTSVHLIVGPQADKVEAGFAAVLGTR